MFRQIQAIQVVKIGPEAGKDGGAFVEAVPVTDQMADDLGFSKKVSFVDKAKYFTYKNIFYDFDKAALRDESRKELDELIELLEINPNVTIELSAHTDRKGTQEYNQKLSQRRAQSVVDYLIAHRIAKDRLTVAGYGKLQPKTVTKNIVKKHDFLKEGDVLTESFISALTPEQQEIADQINRRT